MTPGFSKTRCELPWLYYPEFDKVIIDAHNFPAPGGSSLLTDLIGYWALDEASGNALDAHTNSYDLTETSGTIAATTGIISGCRDFELIDTEYFTIADNADLSAGDVDFTIAAWVQLESTPSNTVAIGKGNFTAATHEYALYYNSVANRIRFNVGAASLAVVDWSSAPSTGVWYFVVAWHDSVANTINIQVNDGTPVSLSHTTGVNNTTQAFSIGAAGAGVLPWDGLIDEVGFWKRVLTSQERTDLYNSGSGLAYPF